ncbi:cytochrome c oxidase subunit 4 [Salinibacillus kushneri]|uniref:Cytochrome c oxidase subunit 4 n=1 Tax=Salinibacillus kushneri TaxID=237682 RepID=A0A1I0CHZ9_9BACI|nr:hypothetical protein [Salinibacillus kushneri]SET18772.1 cytochrome c oxidase subunit 4 [Salinibacillus kushneri]
MIGWLNVGSFVFGLIALILPIINLYKKHDQKNWFVLSVMSIGACAISLFFQIYNSYYRVKAEDWSALMDTMGAKGFAAAVLLIVTLILNVITLFVFRNRTTK